MTAAGRTWACCGIHCPLPLTRVRASSQPPHNPAVRVSKEYLILKATRKCCRKAARRAAAALAAAAPEAAESCCAARTGWVGLGWAGLGGGAPSDGGGAGAHLVELVLPRAAVGAADGDKAQTLATGDDLLQRLESGHRAGGDLVRLRLAVEGEPG